MANRHMEMLTVTHQRDTKQNHNEESMTLHLEVGPISKRPETGLVRAWKKGHLSTLMEGMLHKPAFTES